MGMSQLLTALFTVAAIFVAYRLGLQEGLSLSAETTTAHPRNPSHARAYREHWRPTQMHQATGCTHPGLPF